jgi:cyanate permease
MFLLIFYRDNPEDCGCVADGESFSNRKDQRPPSLPDRDYNLSEARKTRAFWAFTLGITLSALYISGLIFHIVSVFDTAEMTKAKALGIFFPTSLVAIVVQFTCGYISDFIRLKYLLYLFMFGMLMTTTGLILLGDSGPAYWMIISGNGIVWGLYTVLIAVTWPRFYGLKNLGAISGFSLSWAVIGSALGPYIFSLSINLTDNYSAVAWFCAALTVFVILLSLKADNPNEKTRKT